MTKKIRQLSKISDTKNYSISKISKLFSRRPRTINENWHREGLKITKGYVLGHDLREFLTLKTKKIQSEPTIDNGFWCFLTKTKVNFPNNATQILIDYDSRTCRFVFRSHCLNEQCSKKDCSKAQFVDKNKYLLNRLVKKDFALNAYKKIHVNAFSENAQLAVKKLLRNGGKND